jgi:hypothetical protein
MGGEGLVAFLIKGKHINIRIQGLWNLAIESWIEMVSDLYLTVSIPMKNQSYVRIV